MNLTPQEAKAAFQAGKKVEAASKSDSEWLLVSDKQPAPTLSWYDPAIFENQHGMFAFRLAPGKTLEQPQADDGEELDGIALQAMRLIYDKRAWNEPGDPASIAREAYDLAAMIKERKRRVKP